MSGFSPEWLALREPVDHRSRDAALAALMADVFAGRETVRITDLGCGAGSNLRAMAPLLGRDQAWTLVDHDPRLLDAARERLSAWADHAEDRGDVLILGKAESRIAVRFRQADLVAGLEPVLDDAGDLVTAAALFDLVSAVWIDRFVAALSARDLPLYTVLTYDGVETREPAHPADGTVFKAFHHHQATDKGFGPSAGPKAAALMAEAFARAGYVVRTAASPWRLSAPADFALMRSLSEGIAGAARETGLVDPSDLTSWERATASITKQTVGHLDILALPSR